MTSIIVPFSGQSENVIRAVSSPNALFLNGLPISQEVSIEDDMDTVIRAAQEFAEENVFISRDHVIVDTWVGEFEADGQQRGWSVDFTLMHIDDVLPVDGWEES